ncbi:MAG: hypothetical protein K1X88_24845 [Nannocystaceae bacterium]|nr:hypothetical protein [Nannocystaceae bacterium]
MHYRCSACHHDVQADQAPHACPQCHAEAGLEPVATQVPLPMKLFGTLVATALVSSAIAGVLGLVAGG